MWRLAAPLVSGVRSAFAGATELAAQTRAYPRAARSKVDKPPPAEAKRLRAALRELPAVKAPPSARGSSAYGLFVKDNYANARAQVAGEGKAAFAATTRALAQRWKQASATVKKDYESKASDSAARAKLALSKHLASLTPSDHLVMQKRRTLLKKLGKNVPKHLAVPADMPKRPPNPVFAFISDMYKLDRAEQRQKLGRALEGRPTEHVRFLRDQFNALPEREQARYESAYKVGMEKYKPPRPPCRGQEEGHQEAGDQAQDYDQEKDRGQE
ncbi:hypothetical protein DFJ74DRAFT_261103 [Hyaloraphidium curvatum]|nr:hypothetical protein DFJ74DRAFT_261103 [Hyaloraphidium curvatum]